MSHQLAQNAATQPATDPVVERRTLAAPARDDDREAR